VLTQRIDYFIKERGIPAGKILAVTFTNKAAEEMEKRMGQDKCLTSTFHAFCYRVLLGQSPREVQVPFLLLGEGESLKILKEAAASLPQKIPHHQLNEMAQKISRFKQGAGELDTPLLESLYRKARELMIKYQLKDFEDLIADTVDFLSSDSGALKIWQGRYPYIFVDEFQDVNPAQYQLLRLLAPPDSAVTVIGDPNQAIYGFRGADPAFMDRFLLDYREARVFRLTRNFRSTETILKAALGVIRSQRKEGEPTLWSQRTGPSTISLAVLQDEAHEARFVVKLIEEAMGGTGFFSLDREKTWGHDGAVDRSFSDFAVLFRTNAQGEVLERAFQNAGIPSLRVGKEAPSRDQALLGPLALMRFLLYPQNPYVLSRLWEALPGDRDKKDQALTDIREIFPGDWDKAAEDKVDPFYAFLREWGWVEGWEKIKSREGRSLRDKIGPFLLRTELDTYEFDQEAVALMTLHAAKGKEFPWVILTGVEDLLLPYSLDRESSPQEERRLFYVGLTRGREKVVCTRARKRHLYGRVFTPGPSPFLLDIDKGLREEIIVSGPKKSPPRPRQSKLF
jgi:superfamily I DNA/RNA helicase